MSGIKVLFRSPNTFSFIDYNILLSLELVPHPAKLAGIPRLWHLHYLEVSKVIQASSSQLQSVASLRLHAGKSLTHSWIQWLSLASERDSTTPFFVFLTLKSKPRGYSCQVLLLLGLEHGSLVQFHLNQL